MSEVYTVAEAAPWIDLGAECVGTGPNPRDLDSFTIQVSGTKTTEIVERHGVTGLAVGRETEIRLAKPTAIVDVGLAHFGEPPTVVAYERDKAVAEATLDARQRQIENVRLIGTKIDASPSSRLMERPFSTTFALSRRCGGGPPQGGREPSRRGHGSGSAVTRFLIVSAGVI